ncbi:TSC complex subunit 1a [Aplochiton taeniatus]
MAAKDQLNAADVLQLLESSDLQELEQVKAFINHHLSTDRGCVLINSLVDYYVETGSSQATLLLCSIREPHDKHLLDKLNETLTRPACRLASLTLLGHVIRKQPSWMHKITKLPLLPALLKCLKTDSDVVVLITGVLVLITLLPIIPQAGRQHIYDFFDIFGRLASWSLRNPGHTHAVYLIHLHASVYSLFHRLYGMYPCNFISYLRSHYSMKENLDTFQEVVKPMLEHVRVHPELVTGTQDYELDPSRWKRFEIHDIVIECAKVSLDPKESSCEEGYSSTPDPLSPRPRFGLDLPCSPCMDLSSSLGSSTSTPLSIGCPPSMAQLIGAEAASHHSSQTSFLQSCEADSSGKLEGIWSPSSECGLTTPPTSRGISPASVSDLNRTSSSGLRLLTHPKPPSSSSSSHSLNKEEPPCLASTPDRREALAAQINQPLPWSFRPCFTPIESLLPRAAAGGHSPYRVREGDPSLFSPHSPRPNQGPPPPYEPLFQLALPRAAPLFVGRKTQEVASRAGGGGDREGGGGEVEEEEEEEEEEEQSSVSPLEVLDQLILHGHEAHSTLMKRLSMPNKSVDWSHFGGSTPGEELQTVRSQLLLLHSQLLYERYKRQQHAMRNRRLLRRVINATALEEHNHSMKAQLKLQDVEIQSLRASLQEEQQRYTLLKQETHDVTTRLHSQIQHLQLEHQEYYTKAQKLQTELQECQSGLGDLEAELQKANNEAYNAEHQLTQLSLKLSSSEELQQQMFLLNKQLLLLGQTNRLCVEEMEHSGPHRDKEVSMLLDSLEKEQQQLRQSQEEQSLKLDAANQRILDLETQLTKKDHLVQEQKRFLEDVKAQAKNQLAGSDSRYLALRRVSQALQTEMLQLYSQLDLSPQGADRPNDSSVAVPTSLVAPRNKTTGLPPPSSSLSILNGGMEQLASSPLLLLSSSPLLLLSSSPLSLPPVDLGSYPTEGSFLGMHARELFRKPRPEGAPLQSRATLDPRALTQAVRQRRHELSIMDYNETQHHQS